MIPCWWAPAISPIAPTFPALKRPPSSLTRFPAPYSPRATTHILAAPPSSSPSVTTPPGDAKKPARVRQPGNHEFHSGGATPYFDYFGANAGDPTRGYYSYDLGAWHIIVLNSECAEVGGCNSGSTQEKWLREDLQAHPSACTLAYWHKPLFSSGAKHGNDLEVKPFWQDLYAAKVTVVSTATTTITSDSRRRIRTANRTPRAEFANSWWAPVVRTIAHLPLPSQTAKFATPIRSAF